MVITIIIAPFIIKFLYKLKFGQSILIYVEKHKQKGGTARTAIKRAFFMRTIAHIECHWDIVYALLVQ